MIERRRQLLPVENRCLLKTCLTEKMRNWGVGDMLDLEHLVGTSGSLS